MFGLNFGFLSKYWIYYSSGLWMTLKLAFWTLIFSTVIGVVLGMIRVGKHKVVNTVIDMWISFIRGVPVMLIVFIVYYGIATGLPSFWAGIVALTVNSSVYIAEHTRAGMQAVNKGQMEAARCIGMSHLEGNMYIIIPQAIKNILPALGNELITLFKDTSLVTVIGLTDLTKAAQQIQAKTYQAFMPYIGIAIMYLVVVMILTKLLGILERRLRESDRR